MNFKKLQSTQAKLDEAIYHVCLADGTVRKVVKEKAEVKTLD